MTSEASPGGTARTDAERLDLHRTMLLIRRFEERSAELYARRAIHGFLHLYIGQEAVAVGVLSSIGPADPVVATYREHGHALARGVPPRAVMAEMHGRSEGCSGGRGGSMHLFDRDRLFFGGNAIVAAGLPNAVGIALAERMRHRATVTTCFFGDGAVAEGAFHESMNLAALWGLPVLFVCENNGYAMGTAVERALAQTDIATLGRGYGMPARDVDGMDVEAVADESAALAAGVRDGEGPALLVCETYRFRAHSMYDPERYRTKEEVDSWKVRDPILLHANRLRDARILDDGRAEQLEHEVAALIDDAVAHAERGTPEPTEDLERFVHAERASG